MASRDGARGSCKVVIAVLLLPIFMMVVRADCDAASCLSEFKSVSSGNYTVDCMTGVSQAFIMCLSAKSDCLQDLPSLISTIMTKHYQCGYTGRASAAAERFSAPRAQGSNTCYFFCKIGWIHVRCGWECTNKTVINDRYDQRRAYGPGRNSHVARNKQATSCSASGCISEIELPWQDILVARHSNFQTNQGTQRTSLSLLPLLVAVITAANYMYYNTF